MNVLEIKNLTKTYPKFKLDNVSFSVRQGTIMGFIGRNGAGKSTTLKSILNFVHPDSGEIKFFGDSFDNNELEIKQKIGFVSGGINYYSNKKLKTITSVTKSFYKEWNDDVYDKYVKEFNLDETKTPSQLSEGMKVKYSLALALSHNAEFLILDEPTSGIDPVSRDELLEIFLNLSDEGKSILFSTHITSDLDKCADNITYIKEGKIIASESLTSFVNKYMVTEFSKEEIEDADKSLLIGTKRSKNGYTALVKAENVFAFNKEFKNADLEDIMVHFEKESD